MIDVIYIIIFFLFLLESITLVLYFIQQYNFKKKFRLLKAGYESSVTCLITCMNMYMRDTNRDYKSFVDELLEESKKVLKGDNTNDSE